MSDIKLDHKQIFLDALERDSPESLQRYLDEACGGNSDVRSRVEALLRLNGEVGNFLGGPPSQIATTSQTVTERPGTQIGRYKLLEQVGEGGMGVVHVAEQTEPVRRRVALKIIKPGMDTKQVIARFEAERQALAMMDHPNIARVLDAGTTDAGRPYFVMELVRGMPITEYCDKVRLSPRQRLELFIDVCQAVQHAHQKGIIHRDLKPSNVMVTTNDGRPVVKVIDFGVAKAVGQQLTERTVYTALTQLVGTPLYMSPEQAELTSNDVDTRSDVYSLGVLLYELLTGQTPFDKEALSKAGFDEMRRMIREDEPLRPSRRFSTIGIQAISTASQHRGVDERRLSKILSGELDWIVMKALEKDRSRRYESASSLAADIQRYLSDEPVLACPPTTMYRFQKFARKHKASLSTAAAIALCLLLGTTVSAWQAARATTAEAQANANELKANANAAQAQAKTQEATEQRDEAQKQRDEVKELAEQLRKTLYASNMNLAQHSWDAGIVGRVKELLDQHRPKAGETDLRGFEWHYLYRLCHSELVNLKAKSAGTGRDNLAFSPDGSRVASSINGNTVKVWDAQTGKELLSVKGRSSFGPAVAFSPDGKRLAFGVGIWDDPKKAPVAGAVKVCDAQTGQELMSLKGHVSDVSCVAFSPDGKRLASASGGWFIPQNNVEVKVWDAQSGQELLALKADTTIFNMAFSPDGQRLAFGQWLKPTKVVDATTGEELLALKNGVDAAPIVAFSPDGKRLASVRQVWDAEAGKELLSFSKDFPSGVVSSLDASILDLSPDGKRLACAFSEAGVIKVRDAETGDDLFTFKGHMGPLSRAVFSPDGKRLASRSGDGTIKVWDATTSQEARSLGRGRTVSFSPDGKRIAFGRNRNWDETKGAFAEVEMTIADAQTGEELFSITGRGDARGSRVAFSADGKLLACASGDNGVKVWDAQNGKELLTIKGAGRKPVFSPDSKRLACQWNDGTTVGTVKVWDAHTGEEIVALKGHSKEIKDLAYSPDGKRLATHSQDSTVKVWDAQTGQEILTLKVSIPSRSPGSVTFSPDGKRLASSCLASSSYADSLGGIGEVKVWDSETGKELLSLKGHTAAVSTVAFSPDGRRLASGSGNPTGRQSGEMKVWDAETGQELLTFKGGNNFHRVVFSPDGNWLASDAVGTVRIYDATPLPENP